MSRKIGTISLNINAPDFNYGAVLHSWAFQKYLKKYENIDSEIIDYTMPKVQGWNRYNPKRSKFIYTGNREVEGSMEDYLSRAKKFDDFIKNNLNVSEKKYVQKTIADAKLPYDTVICESDVIWSAKAGKLDPVFYLSTPSMRGMRRISYAPSMADAVFTEEQEEQMELLLNNIHFISCRESFMKPLLEKHTDKKVQHVIDPVMLLNPEDYDEITAERIVKEPYLMIYLPRNDNEDLRKSASEYAKKHNLKILEISTVLKTSADDNEICIPDAGIEEFLSAIKYSEMVFTNSFHAICFAIIFQKQFYAFTRKLNGKVLDACRLFDLEEYYVHDDFFVEKQPFDMNVIFSKYLSFQKEGRQWLKGALYNDIPKDSDDYNPRDYRKMYENTSVAYQFLKKSERKGRKIFRISKRLAKAGKRRTKNIISRNIDDIKYTINSKKIRDINNKTDIRKNSIAVMTISDSYNCNPKYICEEMIRRKLPYEITWLVGDDTDLTVFPKEIKTVHKSTKKAKEIVCTAKMWIDNGVCFSQEYDKREEQYHLQTMHGSLGIKRLDNSIVSRQNSRHGKQTILREGKNTNFVLTNSQFEEDAFNAVLWKDVPMNRIGHARTDILFNQDQEIEAKIRQRLKEKYGIPIDKKIVLYAPTHRKGLKIEDFCIDYLDLVKVISEKFGGEYVVLIRMHNKTRKTLLEGIEWTDELEKVLFDATDYPDIQELMLVTDIGITDYSSWIYDYVNTNKPGFIFSRDLGKYNNITGLYYPLEETPFPVCKSHRELVKRIEDFDDKSYKKKVKEFLEEKQSVDDGHSASRAVDLIEELMKK